MKNRIELWGEWNFSFSPVMAGDTIQLPATTEIAKKGSAQPDENQVLYLSRIYPFTGKAYYQREIEIPGEWTGSSVILYLERTKYTEVLVDGKSVSGSHETVIPQEHDLTRVSGAGKHILTIIVDNNLEEKEDFPVSLMQGHQYTDHTQTNWNGILGEIYLERRTLVPLKDIQTFGDWERKGIRIVFRREDEEYVRKSKIWVKGRRSDGQEFVCQELTCQGPDVREGVPELFYFVGDLAARWDEFNPVYFDLELSFAAEGSQNSESIFDTEGLSDTYSLRAYFQQKEVKEKKLLINIVPIFLRGTVDCGIFPRTGACPMEEEEWLRIYRILKAYGLNHYRFHSWCPPDAAFRAADREGIYLQVELSNFANGFYRESNEKCDGVLNQYLEDQSRKVLLQYGNHPSFTIFATGNEMIGEPEAFAELMEQLRKVRPDKFYTQGANNFLEHPKVNPGDDCWIIMRTDEQTNIRASFSHNDPPLGYLQGEELPSTLHDYSRGVEQSPLPLIAHEVGQYQTYPDYREIAKYTGPLSPENLKTFQNRLKEAGMLHQAHDFFRASGKLAVSCYREEIEALLRTRGMAGFQLLGLQDFPGQGTALVGVLDSFFDSKGLIGEEKWREFCNAQVLMAQFPSYVWAEGEVFRAEILLYNYGPDCLTGRVQVSLTDREGKTEQETAFTVDAPRGRLTDVGILDFPVGKVLKAEKKTLVLKMGSLKNEYPLWFYPKVSDYSSTEYEQEDIMVTDEFTQAAEDRLQAGKTVILFSDGARQEKSLEGFFTPDFWCYPMFERACRAKGYQVAPGTMGMVCDHNHPALKLFPCEDYAEWQWHHLLYHSRPLILDSLEGACQPIVQIIDNFDRNHKLGFLLEVCVGKGRLIICACDVLKRLQRPEVYQFYQSIITYAKGDEFQPETVVSVEEIKDIF